MIKLTSTAVAALVLASANSVAQDYAIRSFTIDGGGAQRIAAGTFTLSGTAGQPDAGVLAVGSTMVAGGFWPGTIAEVCVADFNSDGNVNFFDVSVYIAAFNSQSPSADLAAPFGSINFFDIAAFIQIFSQGCP